MEWNEIRQIKVTKNESTESILKLMNELARKRLNEVVGMKLKQLLKIEWELMKQKRKIAGRQIQH